MSLVGFRANNHPQQVTVNGADDEIDDRGTPQDFWDELNATITIPPRVNGPNGYDPASGGCTAKDCGTQRTETVDGVHGRRCAAHPPRPEQPAGGEQA